MTIYAYEADPTAAVTALLAQFTFTAEGNIRYSSGSDTFHTHWLNRAIQKLVWDLEISGDDELNLSKPNPSSSAAIGSIITLKDHTTNYGVRYNITPVEMQYFFGGSIEQTSVNGNIDRFSGLIVYGSVNNSATELQILQENALLTSHWGTGKNQTDSKTLLRILVQTIDDGVTVDGGRVTVKANEWGDTFAAWTVTLGLGEKVASITTLNDPQNTTDLATVQAYSGISLNEGYNLIDVGTDGDKPYLTNATYGGHDRKALYEYVKSLLVRGSTETVFGINGNLITGGPTFSVTLDAGTGGEQWVQNEIVSWSTGTGVLMGVDDTDDSVASEAWIHLLTGVNPEVNDVLAGAAGIQAISSVTTLTQAANLLGVFTPAWIGAFGIGFNSNEVGQADSLQPLDGTTISPPNNVTVSVTVNGTPDGHVLLARSTAGVIDQTQYTASLHNDPMDELFIVNETISADEPVSGVLLVHHDTGFHPLPYTSWSGSAFTLANHQDRDYVENADVIVPIFYHDAVTDGGTVSTTLVQSDDITVSGEVRHGDENAPHAPVAISGTIGAAGLALTVQMESE